MHIPNPDIRRDEEEGITPLRRSAEDGFTLVELMVVIVIIGLLAAIVVINVLPQADKARVTKAKADVAEMDNAIKMYQLDAGRYPTTDEGLQALVLPRDGAKKGILNKLQKDPWGHAYLYASPGQHGDFDVWSLGADGKEGGEGPNADIGSWQ